MSLPGAQGSDADSGDRSAQRGRGVPGNAPSPVLTANLKPPVHSDLNLRSKNVLLRCLSIKDAQALLVRLKLQAAGAKLVCTPDVVIVITTREMLQTS